MLVAVHTQLAALAVFPPEMLLVDLVHHGFFSKIYNEES